MLYFLYKMGIITKQIFLERSNKIHNNFYSYNNMNYIDRLTPITITCPIHGDFIQSPKLHMKGCGCKQCHIDKIKKLFSSNTQDFIQRAEKIHNKHYTYDKVKYINARTNVIITCPIHGDYLQKPYHHLNGHGCPHCSAEIKSAPRKMTYDQFLEKANKLHKNKYDYSLINNDNFGYMKYLPIICQKHGKFIQRISTHLSGCGCPHCQRSKLEESVANILDINDISYIEQYKQKWLNKMRIDFYLPDYNIAIECQGIQHFKPIKFWGGDNALQKIQERDKKKQILCNEHNIKLLYYSQENIEFPYHVYTNINDILNYIYNL